MHSLEKELLNEKIQNLQILKEKDSQLENLRNISKDQKNQIQKLVIPFTLIQT